jgi:hypothetical protein
MESGQLNWTAGVDSGQGKGIFFFIAFRPAVGLTQPPL